VPMLGLGAAGEGVRVDALDRVAPVSALYL
jgi:hypothetical protein